LVFSFTDEGFSMEWSVSAPRPSVFSSITGDQTLYRVHMLSVAEADDLHAAFVEFWRRLLTDGRANCSAEWEVLLFEFWTDAGLLVAVFTDLERRADAPVVFKLSSTEIEREYDGLPNVRTSWKAFSAGYKRLQSHHWRVLREAASTDPIAALLAEWRQERVIPVWGMNCNDMDSMFRIDV
jgi:hypothetical protein